MSHGIRCLALSFAELHNSCEFHGSIQLFFPFWSFLVMCKYWNFWSFIQTVRNWTKSPWNDWLFPTFSEYTHNCICKVDFTLCMQTLWEVCFTELFITGRAQLCRQLFTDMAVVYWCQRFTSAICLLRAGGGAEFELSIVGTVCLQISGCCDTWMPVGLWIVLEVFFASTKRLTWGSCMQIAKWWAMCCKPTFVQTICSPEAFLLFCVKTTVSCYKSKWHQSLRAVLWQTVTEVQMLLVLWMTEMLSKKLLVTNMLISLTVANTHILQVIRC